jgi:hypothetical protein
MSTLLEIVNEVLRRTGQSEVTTVSNPSTPVKQTMDYLNEVYAEMLQTLKINRLERSADFSTATGVSEYNLASDTTIEGLQSDSLLERETNTTLYEVDSTYPQKHGVDASGRPRFFYRSGDSLVLYPKPDKVYNFSYKYLVRPDKLVSDAQTTLLPEEWQRVLIRGAQSYLEQFLGDPNFKTTFLLYQEGLQLLHAKASLKPRHRMFGNYQGYQSS